MPVRLLNKIAPSLSLMKVTFGFDPPNATIGAGIFLATSPQASAALRNRVSHGFQHSVFAFKSFTGDALNCQNGVYQIPKMPGIGVEPSGKTRTYMKTLANSQASHDRS